MGSSRYRTTVRSSMRAPSSPSVPRRRRAWRPWAGPTALGLLLAGAAVLGGQKSLNDPGSAWMLLQGAPAWMRVQAARVPFGPTSRLVEWPTLAETKEPPLRHEDDSIQAMLPPSPVLFAPPEPDKELSGSASTALGNVDGAERIALPEHFAPAETSPHRLPSTLVLGI
jgi:hypothetical protein